MEKKCDIGSGTESGACGYKQGSLPECAPLAVAYVPSQPGSQPSYDPEDALKRGTLFPGLDLPFMNMVKVMFSQRREATGHGRPSDTHFFRQKQQRSDVSCAFAPPLFPFVIFPLIMGKNRFARRAATAYNQ